MSAKNRRFLANLLLLLAQLLRDTDAIEDSTDEKG